MLHSAPCFILVDVCGFDAYYLSHLYGKPCGYDEGHSRKE